MSQLMPSDRERTNVLGRSPPNRCLEPREEVTPGAVAAMVVDTAVNVAALINAVYWPQGEWADRENNRPQPWISVYDRGSQYAVVRLILTGDEGSLRGGGYIEVRVMLEEKVVAADAAYFDVYRQPKGVISACLDWQELDPHSLGQLLVSMYDRLIMEYTVHEWC